jgi:hypothetical protein
LRARMADDCHVAAKVVAPHNFTMSRTSARVIPSCSSSAHARS